MTEAETSDVTVSQGTPRTDGPHQQLEEARKGFTQGLGGSMALLVP